MSKRSHISKKIRDAVIEKYGGSCAYCGKSGLTTPNPNKDYRAAIDHIVSLNDGGSNDFENLQLLCTPCNASKGTRSMDEFIAHMDRRKETERIAKWLTEEIPGIASALPYVLDNVPHDRKHALLKPIYDYIADLKR